MAHELWIADTDSGGQYVNLCGNSTSHPFVVRGVRMPTPRRVRGPPLALDPEDLYEDRQIEVTFDIIDADNDNDPDEVYTSLSKINGLLRKAREQHQNEWLPTVEVRWKATGASNYTCFVLLDGAVENFLPSWDPDVVAGEAQNLRLTLITRPFGRGVSLGGSLAVPMSNGGGSGTGLLTVWNHDDATSGHDNWLDIDTDDLLGDQAALCKFKVVKHASSPNDDYLHEYRLVCHRSDAVTGLKFAFNAEDNSVTTGSLVDDSSAPGTGGTGGIGQRLDFTADGYVEWTVPPTYSQAAYERWQGYYMVVAICCQRTGNSGDWRLRWEIGSYSGAEAVGDWKTPANNISGYWEALELGVLAFPPVPVESPGQSPYVTIRCDEVAGTATLSIAAMYLLPLQHWLLYRQGDYAWELNINYRIWDNISPCPGVNSFTSGDLWRGQSGAEIGSIRTMLLDPQRDHRIGFLFRHWETGGFVDYDIADRIQVQCWYIPRYLHVR